jgi:hypothetical protein
MAGAADHIAARNNAVRYPGIQRHRFGLVVHDNLPTMQIKPNMADLVFGEPEDHIRKNASIFPAM